MFNLKKQHPPFGSEDAPLFEGSYSEGLIEVVDGNCTVNLEATRDRLLKLGYEELLEESTPLSQAKYKKRR
jgi:hypothetical protein